MRKVRWYRIFLFLADILLAVAKESSAVSVVFVGEARLRGRFVALSVTALSTPR